MKSIRIRIATLYVCKIEEKLNIKAFLEWDVTQTLKAIKSILFLFDSICFL